MLTPTSITIISAYKIAQSMPRLHRLRRPSPCSSPCFGWSPRRRSQHTASLCLVSLASGGQGARPPPDRRHWGIWRRRDQLGMRDMSGSDYLPERWGMLSQGGLGRGVLPTTPRGLGPLPARDLWRRKNIFIATVPLMMLCDKIDARRIMLLLILMLLLVGGSPDLIMGLI